MTTQPIQDTTEPIAVLYMQFNTGLFRFKVFESGAVWAECQRDINGKGHAAQQFRDGFDVIYDAPVWDLEQLSYLIERYWYTDRNQEMYSQAIKQSESQVRRGLAIASDEKALIEAYRALNADEQARVEELLDAHDPNVVYFLISKQYRERAAHVAKSPRLQDLSQAERDDLTDILNQWIDRYDQAKADRAAREAEGRRKINELF